MRRVGLTAPWRTISFNLREVRSSDAQRRVGWLLYWRAGLLVGRGSGWSFEFWRSSCIGALWPRRATQPGRVADFSSSCVGSSGVRWVSSFGPILLGFGPRRFSSSEARRVAAPAPRRSRWPAKDGDKNQILSSTISFKLIFPTMRELCVFSSLQTAIPQTQICLVLHQTNCNKQIMGKVFLEFDFGICNLHFIYLLCKSNHKYWCELINNVNY